jgi:hypothetical protein
LVAPFGYRYGYFDKRLVCFVTVRFAGVNLLRLLH